MDANTYQKEAQRTLINVPDREIPQDELQLIWAALTLAIEAGKLVEHFKKGIFHQHGVDATYIIDTLDNIKKLAKFKNFSAMPALSGQEIMKLWVTTGLIGEVTEIAENIKLELENGNPGPIFINELAKEAGDIAWYWASIATQHDIALNDILIGNVTKLQKRYKDGYSSEASKNRQE